MVHDKVKVCPPTPPRFTDYSVLLKQSKQYAQSGQSSKAFEILNDAEKAILAEKKYSQYERDLFLSKVNINRGIMYKIDGMFDKSVKCYERAMETLKRVGDGAEREKFSVELNLAILGTRLRDKERALVGFINAENIVSLFKEPERNQLMMMVLVNRVQMHIEFQEMDEALDVLDRIESVDNKLSKIDNREKKARTSAHLGCLIAHVADKQEVDKNADEHFNHALRFFNEALPLYKELGFTRDIVCQKLNIGQTLISLNRCDEASRVLEEIYNMPELESNSRLKASAAAKLLIISTKISDDKMKEKWMTAVHDASGHLAHEARSDFLEGLESRLRWSGSERLIEHVQELREREE